MTIISDGTGRGFKSEVTTRNRLKTQSMSVPGGGVFSAEGKACVISTGIQNVTTGTTDPLLWFNNTSATESFIISQIRVSWSLTDSVCRFIFRRDVTDEPTANETVQTPTNLNGGSTIVPPISAYKWDGVGNGLTLPVAGTVGGALFATGGTTTVPFDDILIIEPGSKRTISVVAPATGTAFAAYIGYFANTDDIA